MKNLRAVLLAVALLMSFGAWADGARGIESASAANPYLQICETKGTNVFSCREALPLVPLDARFAYFTPSKMDALMANLGCAKIGGAKYYCGGNAFSKEMGGDSIWWGFLAPESSTYLGLAYIFIVN